MALTKTKKANRIAIVDEKGVPVARMSISSIVEMPNKPGFVEIQSTDGRTFQVDAKRIQKDASAPAPKAESAAASSPVSPRKRVTKTKKAQPKKEIVARKPRQSTKKGMSFSQERYDSGQVLQRRVFRTLKAEVPGFSGLPLTERVALNIKALKKIGITADLMPGAVSQMGVHYLSTTGAMGSKNGQAALDQIQSAFGAEVGNVRTVAAGGVQGRAAMGKGNVYNKKDGTVKEKGGIGRREVIKSTRRVAAPKGGYGRRRGRTIVAEGSASLSAMLDQAKMLREADVQTQEARARAGTRYIPSGTDKSGKTTFMKVSAAQGEENAIQKSTMARLSKMGEGQNFERLVTIAQRYISDARAAGAIPSEGGYTALLKEQPQFKDIDPKDLSAIVRTAKKQAKMSRVTRKEKRRPAREKTDKKTTLSTSGAEVAAPKKKVTRRKVVSTRSGLTEVVTKEPRGKRQAAVAQAEADVARDQFKVGSTYKDDKRAAAMRGEEPKRKFTPAKPVSLAEARRLEREVAAGKRGKGVFKRRTTKAAVAEGVASGKVRIKTPSLSKSEKQTLAALGAVGNKAGARRIADAMGASQRVRSVAKAKGLLSVAATFGANYILSQLAEEKKGKR